MALGSALSRNRGREWDGVWIRKVRLVSYSGMLGTKLVLPRCGPPPLAGEGLGGGSPPSALDLERGLGEPAAAVADAIPDQDRIPSGPARRLEPDPVVVGHRDDGDIGRRKVQQFDDDQRIAVRVAVVGENAKGSVDAQRGPRLDAVGIVHRNRRGVYHVDRHRRLRGPAVRRRQAVDEGVRRAPAHARRSAEVGGVRVEAGALMRLESSGSLCAFGSQRLREEHVVLQVDVPVEIALELLELREELSPALGVALGLRHEVDEDQGAARLMEERDLAEAAGAWHDRLPQVIPGDIVVISIVEAG